MCKGKLMNDNYLTVVSGDNQICITWLFEYQYTKTWPGTGISGGIQKSKETRQTVYNTVFFKSPSIVQFY